MFSKGVLPRGASSKSLESNLALVCTVQAPGAHHADMCQIWCVWYQIAQLISLRVGWQRLQHLVSLRYRTNLQMHPSLPHEPPPRLALAPVLSCVIKTLYGRCLVCAGRRHRHPEEGTHTSRARMYRLKLWGDGPNADNQEVHPRPDVA